MIWLKIITGTLFFFVLILFLPVRYDLKIRLKDNKPKFFFVVRFFFGLLEYNCGRVKFFGLEIKREICVKKKKRVKKNLDEKKEIKARKKINLAGFDYKEILDLILVSLGFIRDIIKNIKPKKIILKGEVGFDNPEYTGYFCVLESFLCEIKKFDLDIDIKHDFDKEIFDLDIDLYGRSVIFSLIFILIRYIFDKKIFGLVRKNFFNKGD